MTDETKSQIQSITRHVIQYSAGAWALKNPDLIGFVESGIAAAIALAWTWYDNKSKSIAPVVVPSTTSTISGVKLMAFLAFVFLFTGCARFVGQTETKADGTSITRFRAYTFFDSKNDLTKVIVRQTTTNKLNQSFGIGSVDQTSQTSTNFNSLVSDIVGAAIKAAVKP